MARAKEEVAPTDEVEAVPEKPNKVRIVCAGHVIEADPVPPSPPPLTRDSVTGQIVDPANVADGGGGWTVGED